MTIGLFDIVDSGASIVDFYGIGDSSDVASHTFSRRLIAILAYHAVRATRKQQAPMSYGQALGARGASPLCTRARLRMSGRRGAKGASPTHCVGFGPLTEAGPVGPILIATPMPPWRTRMHMLRCPTSRLSVSTPLSLLVSSFPCLFARCSVELSVAILFPLVCPLVVSRSPGH